MSYATIHGYSIHYESYGTPAAIPLIFIHGVTNSIKNWRDIPQRLSAEYYCIAVDLLGFGESAKPPDHPLLIEQQGEIVLGLMDALQIDRAVLLGHSMGGEIVLWIASHHPDRVAKAVAVSAVIEGTLSMRANFQMGMLWLLARYIPASGPFWRRLFRPPSLFRTLMVDRNCYYRSHPNEMLYEIFDEMFRPDNFPNKAAGITALYRYRALDDAQRISSPLLIVAADKDTTVPLKQSLALKKRLPAAQLVTLRDCGHMFAYDASDEFVAAVEKFLA